MKDTKILRANCVAYCRDQSSIRKIRFARVTRVKSASLIGDLAPANAEWPVVLLLPIDVSETRARTLLNRMAVFLDETMPARVEGIAISNDGETVKTLSKANLMIERAKTPDLRSPDQLHQSVSLPWSAAVFFGRPYSFQDASNYIRATFRNIREGEGLYRGRLATPWGSVKVYEGKERGLYAVLKSGKWWNEDDDLFRGTHWNFRARAKFNRAKSKIHSPSGD